MADKSLISGLRLLLGIAIGVCGSTRVVILPDTKTDRLDPESSRGTTAGDHIKHDVAAPSFNIFPLLPAIQEL